MFCFSSTLHACNVTLSIHLSETQAGFLRTSWDTVCCKCTMGTVNTQHAVSNVVALDAFRTPERTTTTFITKTGSDIETLRHRKSNLGDLNNVVLIHIFMYRLFKCNFNCIVSRQTSGRNHGRHVLERGCGFEWSQKVRFKRHYSYIYKCICTSNNVSMIHYCCHLVFVVLGVPSTRLWKRKRVHLRRLESSHSGPW